MADETSRAGQPGYEPLPGWPAAPEPETDSADTESPPPGRPPSAPPPGWTGRRPPWAEAPPEQTPAPPGGPSLEAQRAERGRGAGAGRLSRLRGRRGLALAAGAVVLVLLAAVGFVVATSGGGEQGATGGGRTGGGTGPKIKAPNPVAGVDMSLLDGRLVVVAPPGWEQREVSTDTATVKIELRQPGRELLGTLVTVALPSGGSLDATLAVDGGSRFEVTTGAGPIQATALPETGTIRAGTARPNATFFFTLSVAALDGNPLDGPLLQKLFAEQVAPQLRFP